MTISVVLVQHIPGSRTIFKYVVNQDFSLMAHLIDGS